MSYNKNVNESLWVWGYVLDKIPGKAPFVFNPTCCSLETACSYLGAGNAVFMNSMDDISLLKEENFTHMADVGNVVCALQHGNYIESARIISRFSLSHPNISGAIIDDFLDASYRYKGPSANMAPGELKEIRDALRSENPNLKLYVVRYTWQNPEALLPYRDYFDVLNLWVWVSTNDYWNSKYHNDLVHVLELYDKPVMQGMFIHHYGFDASCPMEQELLETQCRRIGDELRNGNLSSWCVLQSGWFCRESHRNQITWLKNFMDWFFGTWTRR